jgi:hypothetical protein
MASFAAGAVATAVTMVVVLWSAGLIGGAPLGGAGSTLAPTEATPSPTPQPTIDRSYRDVGFIGLPPLDAMPSDPTRTELVENFWRSRLPYSGQSFLYADGRLVWNEYLVSPRGTTGWLEQTVTADGIELVRAVATEPDLYEFRLLDPAELPGQLPADAWVDQVARPYVPSGFGACLFVSNQDDPFNESPMTLPEKLAALPAAVSDILRDHPHVPSPNAYVTERITAGTANTGGGGGEPPDCLEMDVADARLLDAALREAGFAQDERRNVFLLEYHMVVDRPEPGLWWLSIWFEPILPDGTITCSSCG